MMLFAAMQEFRFWHKADIGYCTCLLLTQSGHCFRGGVLYSAKHQV